MHGHMDVKLLFIYIPRIFIVYYYLFYQQMHARTNTHIFVLKYQVISHTLLHVSVLLHLLHGALILRLLKLSNIKIIKFT